jgi:NAD+ kinase
MFKFGIYTNFDKDKSLLNTRKVIGALNELGMEIYLDRELSVHLEGSFRPGIEKTDFLFVLGGDGTILSAARKYAGCGTKIIGINLGRMGFLAEIEPEEVPWALERIAGGKYNVESRMMLKADSESFDETLIALNDFVVSPRNVPRMVSLELKINGAFAEKYYCDGMIISSPTGSTGYTISAGGPIIAPSVNCILVTPVCAHTLNARSIVLNENDEVEIKVLSHDIQAYVTADGQQSKRLGGDATVVIKKSDSIAQFVRLKDGNFFELLKVKLAQWQTDDRE